MKATKRSELPITVIACLFVLAGIASPVHASWKPRSTAGAWIPVSSARHGHGVRHHGYYRERHRHHSRSDVRIVVPAFLHRHYAYHPAYGYVVEPYYPPLVIERYRYYPPAPFYPSGLYFSFSF